jgi:hypothetical protein
LSPFLLGLHHPLWHKLTKEKKRRKKKKQREIWSDAGATETIEIVV